MSQEFELSIKSTHYDALVAVLHEAMKRGLMPTLKPVEITQGSFRTATPVRSSPRATVAGPVEDRWDRFLRFCSPGQLEVLTAIKEHRAPTTSADLSQVLGITTNTFTGRLNGGIQKNAKKAGFEVSDVVIIGEHDSNITYSPGRVLEKHDVVPPGETQGGVWKVKKMK